MVIGEWSMVNGQWSIGKSKDIQRPGPGSGDGAGWQAVRWSGGQVGCVSPASRHLLLPTIDYRLSTIDWKAREELVGRLESFTYSMKSRIMLNRIL
jgi:hypothetical protein